MQSEPWARQPKSKSPVSIAVVLCCEAEASAWLSPVIEVLAKEGHETQVITDTVVGDGFRNAVDRAQGACVFVLCQTDTLDRVDTRRLSGLFSARKGPNHRMITAHLKEKRPLALIPPIRAAIQSLADEYVEGGEEPAPSSSSNHLRDVVGQAAVSVAVASRSESTTRPVDPEALAREFHRGMTAAAALIDRTEELGHTGSSQWLHRKHVDPHPDETARGSVVDESMSSIGERTIPQPSVEAAPPPDSEPYRPSSRAMRWVWGAWVVAALGLARFAVGVLEEDAAPMVASESREPSAPTSAENRKPPAPSIVVAPVAPAHVPPPASVPSTDAGPGEKSASKPDKVPRARDHTVTVPPSVHPDSPTARAARLRAAGMARSVGELLLLTAQSEALPLADARDFCAAVDVFGVAGWRLPKDAELRALRGVLNQRLYWSSQPDGHGDGRAMEGKTGTFHVYLPIEPIAHAACVRRR